MNKINKNTIRSYVKKLEARGYSFAEIQKKLASLEIFINWLKETKKISYSNFVQLQKTIKQLKNDYFAKNQATEVAKQSPILSIEQFEKAAYAGEKKASGIFGEISIKFHLQTYKIKSFLVGIIRKIPLLNPKSEIRSSKQILNSKFEIPNLGIQHYIAFLFILLFISLIGAGLYNRFFLKVERPFAYPLTPVRAGRTLNFQGRLTDSLGNPITTSTNVQFKLYNVSSGGSPLYQTGSCSISPDQDGIFNVIIGSDCGSEIPNSVFTENPNVYLGVTVGPDAEMTPRQPIANVGYAINAETLQGFPPGTQINTIPFINNDGNLLIAVANPGIRSTFASADFTISSAKTAVIQSAGTGDVILQATESGTIKLRTGGNTDTNNRLTISNTGTVAIPSLSTGIIQSNSSGELSSILGTSGYFPKWNASGLSTTSSIYENTSGNVGIGTTNPTGLLELGPTYAGANQTLKSLITNTSATGNNSGPAYNYNLYNNITTMGNLSNSGYGYGIYNNLIIGGYSLGYGVYNVTSNTANTVGYGVYNDLSLNGAGARYGTYSKLLSTWSSANIFGNYVESDTNTTAGTQYAYYADMSSGTATKWGLYISGENRNYLSGNVGIGTTGPGAKLEVQGGDIKIGNPPLTSYKLLGVLGSSDTRSSNYNPEQYYMGIVPEFKTNSVIGLTGEGSFSGLLTYRQWSSGTDWTGGGVHQLAFGSSGNIHHRYSQTTGSWGSWARLLDTANVIKTSNVLQIDGTANSYIMGNVGIGTTSPSYKLDVNGDIFGTNLRTSGDLYIAGTALSANTTTTSGASLVGLFDDSMNYISGNTNVQSAIKQLDTAIGSLTGSAGGWTDDGTVVRLTTITDRVGIGTTSPHANTKLGVLGGVAIGSQAFSDTQAPTNGLIVEGNVGIGTTSPQQKLSVVGDIGLSGTNRFIGTTDNYALSLRTNNTDRVYITNSGNVGIGTTNLGVINTNSTQQWGLDPDDKILVLSNSTGSTLNLENTLPLDSANIGQRLGAIVFSNTSGQADAHRQLVGIVSRITGVSGSPIYTYQADLGFFTKSAAGAAERMTITASGNVGIGTTSPSHKLEVTQSASTSIRSGYFSMTSGTSGTEYIVGQFNVGGSGAQSPAIAISSNNTVGLKLTHSSNFTIGTIDHNYSSATALAFAVRGSEKMRVDNSGNVGIGTTSPGARLDILPSSSSDVVFRTKSLQSTAPLGSELVSNGDFSTTPDTSWTWGTGWTHDTTNLEADHTTGNTAPLTQNISVTNGQTYQVEITIKNRTTGSVTLNINGVYIYNYGSTTALDSNTTYKRSLVANITGSATLSITPTSDFNGSVGNITVKQITGVSQPNFALLDDAGSVMAEIRGKSSLSNLALGTNALRRNTTGYYNSAIGTDTLYFNTTGYNNSAIGVGALYSNTTGNNNSAIGAYALYSNTTGYYNLAIGYQAGRYITGGSTANQTSNTSVYLGAETKAYANGDSNEIVIGYNTTGFGSNSAAYGNSSMTKHIFQAGNVGIGTTDPVSKFHVQWSPTGCGTQCFSDAAIFENNGNVFIQLMGSSAGEKSINFANPSNGADGAIKYNYSTVPNGFSFWTGGNQFRVAIDQNGNVGIGTNTPSYKLEVSGTFRASGNSYFGSNVYFANGTTYYVDASGNAKFNDLIAADTANPGLTVGNNTIGFLKVGSSTIFDNNNPFLAFDPNSDSTPEMVITDSGNVGIGTTSSSYKLDVIGTFRASGNSYFGSNVYFANGTTYYVDASGNAKFNDLIVADTGNPGLTVGNNTIGFLKVGSSTIFDNNNPFLAFDPNSDLTADMVITDSGNVGIGTTNPIVKLVINNQAGEGQIQTYITTADDANSILGFTSNTSGTAKDARIGLDAANQVLKLVYGAPFASSTNGIMINSLGNVGVGTITPVAKLDIFDNSTSGFGEKLAIRRSGAGDIGLSFQQNGVTAFGIVARSGAGNGLAFVDNYYEGNSGTERMRILNNGNVGIGTTSPGNKLSVVGGNIAWGSSEQNNLGTDQGGNIELGGTNSIANPVTGGVPYIDFHYGTGTVQDFNTRIINAANNRLDFITNSGGTVMSINSGNVGIGTTNPLGVLNVIGNASSNPAPWGFPIGLFMSNNDHTRFELKALNSTLVSQIVFTNGSNNQGWSISSRNTFDSPNYALKIYYYTGSSWNIPIVINSDNTVWFGTSYNSAYSKIDVNFTGGGTQYGIEMRPANDNTNAIQFDNAAGTWVGGIYTTNTSTSYQTGSDIRLKENITNSNRGLNELLKINIKEFNFINDSEKKRVQGFIAQDLFNIYPEAVVVGGENPLTQPWSVDYGRVTPLIVKSIQDLYNITRLDFTNQQSQISSFSAQLVNLQKDLNLTSTGDLQIVKQNQEYAYDGNLYDNFQFSIFNFQSIFNDQIYNVKTKTGEVINRIGAFSELVVGKIKSGLIEAENTIVNNTLLAKNIIAENLNLTTDNLTIAGKKLSEYIDEKIQNFLTTNYYILNTNKIVSPVIETEEIQLKTQNAKLKTTTENAKLEITDKDNTPVAQFNTDEKKTTLFGSLEVKNDQNKGKLAEVIIKGLNDAIVARIDNQGNASLSGTLTAKEVQSEKLKVGSLEGQEATISGKLIAKEVEAENINQLNQQLASQSADINQIQQLLAQLKDAPLPDTANMTNLSNTTNLENLTVTGNANLYNLNVSNSLVVGNLLIENDKILSLSWELKLSALAQISFFDQAVVIAKDGTITTKGAMIAQGGIKTNTIQAVNDGEDINIKLKTQNSKLKTTAENAKLNIIDELGNVQASIDASGSAFFKALSLEKFTPATPAATIVSPQDNFEKRGVFAAAIETASASAGIGILPQNQQEVIIYNDNVKEDSLIYITPQNTVAQKLTVGEKAKGYFKVITDTTNHPDIKFDWLIIN